MLDRHKDGQSIFEDLCEDQLTIFVECRRCNDVVDDHIIAFKRTLNKHTKDNQKNDSLFLSHLTLFTNDKFFRDEFGHGIVFLECPLKTMTNEKEGMTNFEIDSSCTGEIFTVSFEKINILQDDTRERNDDLFVRPSLFLGIFDGRFENQSIRREVL
jgi:hypothetical protein